MCIQLEKQEQNLRNRDGYCDYISVNKRGLRWGKETIKKYMQIKFTTDFTVFKTLQQMQIPLPIIHTLQRRMQHVKLEPGVTSVRKTEVCGTKNKWEQV